MPILHTINDELGIVLSSWYGAITDGDILASYQKLYENPRWRPGFNEIVDTRDAQVTDVTVECLRRLSALVERYVADRCEGFKTAIIAPEDLSFGLARLYEALREESPEHVMVFRNMDGVLSWMGVWGSLTVDGEQSLPAG